MEQNAEGSALFSFFSLPIKAFHHNRWLALHLAVNSLGIALVMQVMNAEKQNPEVLVFDEIDVGIGGTAEVVGHPRRSALSAAQLLCILTKLSCCTI